MIFHSRCALTLCLSLLIPSVGAEPLTVVSLDSRPAVNPESAGERIVTVRFLNSVEGNEAPFVVAQIPAGSRYVEGSATGPGASIDTVYDDPETEAEGDRPSDAGHDARVASIRWNLRGPMETGVRGIVAFRIIPETMGAAEDPEVVDPASGPQE